MIRSSVALAVKTAKRWRARLYGVATDFRTGSLVRRDYRRALLGMDGRVARPHTTAEVRSVILTKQLLFETCVYGLAVFGG